MKCLTIRLQKSGYLALGWKKAIYLNPIFWQRVGKLCKQLLHLSVFPTLDFLFIFVSQYQSDCFTHAAHVFLFVFQARKGSYEKHVTLLRGTYELIFYSIGILSLVFIIRDLCSIV